MLNQSFMKKNWVDIIVNFLFQSNFERTYSTPGVFFFNICIKLKFVYFAGVLYVLPGVEL